MQKTFKVAVVGATGAVGAQLLSILEERKFPVQELKLFASVRSLGRKIYFKDQKIKCSILEEGCFADIDLAFFDASDAVSKDWVPEALRAGAWAIDNSAIFRLDSGVSLVVPEVNGELLTEKYLAELAEKGRRLITGPNCSTVQLVVPLKVIRDNWGIRRVVVSTYQSASGAGTSAVTELREQTEAVLNDKPFEVRSFSNRIAFNCIPHIGRFSEDGSTSEEKKIVDETRKILSLPDLRISATAVRVPTLSCHAESINIECERPFDLDEVRLLLQRQAGVVVQDDPLKGLYPLGCSSGNVEAATGRDSVYVGRIRRDKSIDNGLNLWAVSDNLRKGAALNAVQIGEIILRYI
ncbi:MAG: aspartate-semialdehyde dehydrogenase [Bdellovibrionales bacterium RIFOXYD1_FULL_44_7]|nr:MAG: aspartate-semialdehyde dehydrogenase [Bdellovibrionales bacterium RIFOXYD1_FULL_44_7]